MKRALIGLALGAALLAACGGSRITEPNTVSEEEVQAALKSADNAPPVLDTVFLDFGDGTVHTHPAGQDVCAGKVLPNVADIGCDNACKDAIVTAVANDFSNPLYATAANPYGKLPLNVTRVKPGFPNYHTVVVVQSGAFCGMAGWNGTTPAQGQGCSGDSTRIFATSYVFDLRAPGSAADMVHQIPAAPQDVADTIAHEVGHQYGLVHSGPWPYLGADIMGPSTAWQYHFFAWGSVPVYAASNPCGYATQDDFGQMFSWVQLGHSMR